MRTQEFVVVSLIALSTSLESWGTRQTPTPPPPNLHFPLSDQQEWFTKESYILWKPYLRDIDLGRREAFNDPNNFTSFLTLKPKRPDFDWSSGFRIGLGKYLPHHDLWDVNFYMTYLYVDASRKVTPKDPDAVSPDFSPPLVIGSHSSSARWSLNYYTWDLSLGRLFNLPYSISIHPFVGFRGALFDQDYKVRHKGDNIQPFEQTFFTDRFKGSNDYWGIGPRAGVDLSFEFEKHWALLGHLGGSILYGYYHVEEKINAHFLQIFSMFSSDFNQNLRGKDHQYAIRTNLETSFGLGWETWLKNHTVRIAPSLVFEAGVWFYMNQFYDLQTVSGLLHNNITFVNTRHKHGNFVYSGFNFNLQVDF